MQDETPRVCQQDMRFSISEVAAMTGITPSNLRFFEDEGILEIPRNGAGHRIYTRKEMEELLGLVCLKHAGMELRDIKEFFRLVRQGDHTLHERQRMLEESCASLKKRIKELQKCLKYSQIKAGYIKRCRDAYDRGESLPSVDPEWMDSFLTQKF